MTWQIELKQQKNTNGELLPLWTVIQWNTNDTNTKYETTITTAVKEIAYPD